MRCLRRGDAAVFTSFSWGLHMSTTSEPTYIHPSKAHPSRTTEAAVGGLRSSWFYAHTARAAALSLWMGMSLASQSASAAVVLNTTVEGWVQKVSQAELRPVVEELSGEKPATIGGQPYTFSTNRFSNGHVPGSWNAPIDLAEQYLYEHLVSYGLTNVKYQLFPGNGNPMSAPEGRNVIAEITGKTKPSEIVVVGCHIDNMNDLTWPNGRAPGADDNASGCSALLYLARNFVGHEFARTIRFAFFDAEENAPWTAEGYLFGSGYYAYQAKAAGENIVAMIEADGLAYNPTESAARVVEMHVRKSSADPGGGDLAIYNLWRDVMTTYKIDNITPRKMDKCTTSTTCGSYWSDNGAFWKWGGYNAVLLVEEEWVNHNPNWHTAGDTIATFDWTQYIQATRSLVALAAHQAGFIQ